MSYAFIGVLFFLALYGFICCIINLSRNIVNKEIDGKYVVLYVDEENAECSVRCTAFQNPDSEIIVINKTPSAKTTEILSRLEREYKQIHIL